MHEALPSRKRCIFCLFYNSELDGLFHLAGSASFSNNIGFAHARAISCITDRCLHTTVVAFTACTVLGRDCVSKISFSAVLTLVSSCSIDAFLANPSKRVAARSNSKAIERE